MSARKNRTAIRAARQRARLSALAVAAARDAVMDEIDDHLEQLNGDEAWTFINDVRDSIDNRIAEINFAAVKEDRR